MSTKFNKLASISISYSANIKGWISCNILKCSHKIVVFVNIKRYYTFPDILRKYPEHSLYIYTKGPSWSWSYGSWIYTYLCNQFLSPLTLWVRTPIRRGVLDTTLCDKVGQWLAAGRWFSPVLRFPTLIELTATK